jgi:transketolase
LGSAVAEVLVEGCPVPMERLGIRDTFAESGDYDVLLEKYGLGITHIMNAIKEAIRRKQVRV